MPRDIPYFGSGSFIDFSDHCPPLRHGHILLLSSREPAHESGYRSR
jgi:hypothetical protein